MEEFFRFFEDFGNLINTTILFSLVGIAFRVFRNTIAQKNAELNAVRERLNTVEMFSVDNVAKKFEALKTYYKTNVEDWYDASLKSLEVEKERAIEAKEREFQDRIEQEISKRRALMKQYSTKQNKGFDSTVKVSTSQICGDWSVTGHNPFTRDYSYYGTLTIGQKNEVLIAKWETGPRKKIHKGIGLIVGNMIGFEFEYAKSDKDERGIVLYEVISAEIMRGYWTGYGATKIGFEECRKSD